MAKFIVIEKATQQQTDLWEGVVEYEGENVSYRFYDGHDEQVAYVLIDGEGWVYDGQKHPLINILFSYIKETGMPPEFGSVGEVNEIEDENIEEHQ